MGSFGERLRREREMRGITIEEIAEATKIGSRSLRALEEEKFDRLPGGIFNKGFVRAYARYLGIDEEQAVSDYMNAEAAFRSGSGQDEEVESPVVERESAASSERSNAPVLIGLVVIAVLAGSGWWYWNWRKTQKAAQETGNPPVAAAVQTQVPQPVATAPTTSAPAEAAAPAATTSAPADPKAAPSQTPTTPVSTQPATTSTQPVGSTDGFVVSVRAKEDSWIQATADGKSVIASEVLKSAAERSLRAHDRLVLTLGNAGGVEISYNGKPQQVAAAANQKKTLIFTTQGLQP